MKKEWAKNYRVRFGMETIVTVRFYAASRMTTEVWVKNNTFSPFSNDALIKIGRKYYAGACKLHGSRYKNRKTKQLKLTVIDLCADRLLFTINNEDILGWIESINELIVSSKIWKTWPSTEYLYLDYI